jgi:hypothetical protein
MRSPKKHTIYICNHKLQFSCNKQPANFAYSNTVLLHLSNEATTHRSTYFTILTCSPRVIVIVLRHVGRVVIFFQSIIVIVIVIGLYKRYEIHQRENKNDK